MPAPSPRPPPAPADRRRPFCTLPPHRAVDGKGGAVFILFGFRTRPAELAALSLACRNGHVAGHRIHKVVRWFTLFFIPVIPLSRRYSSVCLQCGLTLKLTREEADALVARAAATPVDAPADPVAPPLATGGPPAGWYSDPSGGAGQRYWDGRGWTDAVQPA